MARPKERICEKCGKIDITSSKSTICMDCHVKKKQEIQVQEEINNIISWGYTLLAGPIDDEKFQGKRRYEVTNPNCDHTFTTRYDNLNSTVYKRDKIPCGICGRDDNKIKMLDGFIEKYGRDHDKTQFNDYSILVRALAEKTYRLNKDLINPTGYPRKQSGKPGAYHLDHKVPVAICFRFNVPVEMAASLENLIIVPWEKNLKKSWYHFDANLLDKLAGKKIKHDELNVNVVLNYIKQVGKDNAIIRKNTILVDNKPFCTILKDHESCVSKKDGCLVIRNFELNEKRDVVLSRLANRLGVSEKIYARKCKIVEITNKQEANFLEQCHIQGKVGSKVAYGLMYENELVALMTFGKPRFNKNHDWELLRYCTSIGINVIGGASKLLSHFRKLHLGNIISYADYRWSDGNLYEKLGFTKVKLEKSGFYYTDGIKIVKRYAAQKHKLSEFLGGTFDRKKSAIQNMVDAGYMMVKDPGQLVFSLQ